MKKQIKEVVLDFKTNAFTYLIIGSIALVFLAMCIGSFNCFLLVLQTVGLVTIFTYFCYALVTVLGSILLGWIITHTIDKLK